MRVLGGRGHEVRGIGVTSDVAEAMAALRELGPTVVFNLCESLEGDNRFESLVPMLMELEGLVYTGSGPLALTLALHKHKAKQILRSREIATPNAVLLEGPDTSRVKLRYPLI